MSPALSITDGKKLTSAKRTQMPRPNNFKKPSFWVQKTMGSTPCSLSDHSLGLNILAQCASLTKRFFVSMSRPIVSTESLNAKA